MAQRLLNQDKRDLIIWFVKNYVSEHALEDPVDGILILPFSFTYEKMHKQLFKLLNSTTISLKFNQFID